MTDAILMLFPLVFTNNLVVSAVKWLSDGTMGSGALRAVLALLSVVGAISASALTGQPVNFDSVSQLALTGVMALALFVGSHLSYKAIKKAPSPAN